MLWESLSNEGEISLVFRRTFRMGLLSFGRRGIFLPVPLEFLYNDHISFDRSVRGIGFV